MHELQYGPPAVAVKVPFPARPPGNGVRQPGKPGRKTLLATTIADLIAFKQKAISEIARDVGISPSYLRAAAKLTPAERWAVRNGERPLVTSGWGRPPSLSKQIARLVAEFGADRAFNMLVDQIGVDCAFNMLVEMSAGRSIAPNGAAAVTDAVGVEAIRVDL